LSLRLLIRRAIGSIFLLLARRPPGSTLSPYTTLFRSYRRAPALPAAGRRRKVHPRRAVVAVVGGEGADAVGLTSPRIRQMSGPGDRKSTRLNSSHVKISYAVFCLKKKNDPLLAPPAHD